MSINKIVAREQGDPLNSTGADLAESVNASIDIIESDNIGNQKLRDDIDAMGKTEVEHLYGGDLLDDEFGRTYASKGVGYVISDIPEGFNFNKLTIWGGISGGSTSATIKIYYVDPTTPERHVPSVDGTSVEEIIVDEWDSTLSKRIINLTSQHLIPAGTRLYILIVPSSGTGKAIIPRWTTQGGGGTYPLEKIMLTVASGSNAGLFNSQWLAGSSDFLTVPPELEHVPAGYKNYVTDQDLEDTLATVIPESLAGYVTDQDLEDTLATVIPESLAGYVTDQGLEDTLSTVIPESLAGYVTDQELEDTLADIDTNTLPIITLPDTVVAVVGKELNLYYDGFILGRSKDTTVQVRAFLGKSMERQYRITPTTGDVGTHEATLTLFNARGMVILTKSFNLKVIPYEVPVSTPTVVQVGDSLNSNSQITQTIHENFTLLGGDVPTFSGNSGNVPYSNECYGGWTYRGFVASGRVNHRFEVSSVTNIGLGDVYTNNGEEYTVTEINVTAGSGNINTKSSSNINPLSSGVLSKVSGSGDTSLSYSSYTLEAGNPFWNPDTNMLDIANYRNNLNIPSIDMVTIQLGINESFKGYYYDQTAINLILEDAKALVDSFLADNSAVNILIVLPSTCGNTKNGFASNYGANYSKIHYEHNIYALRIGLIDTFDLGAYSSNVSISSAGLVIDRLHGYDRRDENVAARITDVQESRHTNGVHPRQEGYNQMADCMFAEMLNIINS